LRVQRRRAPGQRAALVLRPSLQQHDGAIDITNAADLVTVSWNRSPTTTGDADREQRFGQHGRRRRKLNVSVHHNLFDRLVQRMPACASQGARLQQLLRGGDGFSYAWGVGIASQIFAENNFFEVRGGDSGEFIDWYKKPASALERTDIGIYVGETLVNGPRQEPRERVERVQRGQSDEQLARPSTGGRRCTIRCTRPRVARWSRRRRALHSEREVMDRTIPSK